MAVGIVPLEIYPLRQIWTNEARDFTPWLAQPAILSHLGHVLGLGELQLEAIEQPIGDFSLDILARDPLGHRVVIENQLETSDHRHLGQLLTYAAATEDGLTIIWISAAVRREHAAALAWLNAMTHESVRFFGVEITAWQTSPGSPPGYQFRVRVSPDADDRSRKNTQAAPLSEEQVAYQAYWSAFRDYLSEHDAQHWLRPDLPRGTWYGRNVGRPGFNFYALIKPKERALAVMLEISTTDHGAKFAALRAERDAIEHELGMPAQWTSTDARDYVTIERAGSDFRDREHWPEQHAWLLATLERFRLAFTPRIVASLPTDTSTRDHADE
jgi:hypothetical protein